MDIHKTAHLLESVFWSIFVDQIVKQFNRKVNNISWFLAILYTALKTFVVHALQETQNKVVKLRQFAVHSVGVVCPLLLEVCLSQTKSPVNVLLKAVAEIGQTHPIFV